MCVFNLFCEFNEYLVDLVFIAKITSCFDVEHSCLLCEMLPIMQLTPEAIVCKMKECHMFVTLTTSFSYTIDEL